MKLEVACVKCKAPRDEADLPGAERVLVDELAPDGTTYSDVERRCRCGSTKVRVVVRLSLAHLTGPPC